MNRASYELHDETLHPSQHFTANRATLPGDGERRLMAAILEDAVGAYVSACKTDTPQARELLGELIEWFADEDDTYLFSFPSICDFLEIRPDTVRGHLKEAHWQAVKERARRAEEEASAEEAAELAVDENGLDLPRTAVASN